MNERTWPGYPRADGRKGIRNIILVVYTVECAGFVAHTIGRDDDDVHVIGLSGCYDNQYAVRMMLALGRHPNVGAVLAVGLGCEYTQPARILEIVSEAGRPAEWFYIQENGGTESSFALGKELVAALRQEMNARVKLTPMGWPELVVGAECGGSDGTSGLAGNPVVGAFFDLLVDRGGSAIFEETVEMIGLRDLLCSRAASPEAVKQLEHAYDQAERYCGEVRQYSVAPGNFAGGLTTIEEKSMGAFAKSGSRSIQGVIRVSEQPHRKGLWLLDSLSDSFCIQFGYTNPNDTEGIMDLISAGSHIVLFVTGRGRVIGSPIAPLPKITGNILTYERMRGDMDSNAGRILSGQSTLLAAAMELAEMVEAVARGAPTKPEALQHREYFLMYKHQDAPSLEAGCHA